ncbi:biopolymer transport protein ExbD [Verrucomicrobiota bacterium]|jgi:biopolymer transport protein ExbD|nr:biopolymer transport protein ExbD [Verrucomicrobiota bacterium]
MARSFSKQSRLHVISELNVTPMLDLCFVLLIIFMIATPVLEQTTAINLPKSDKGVGKAAESKTQYRFVTIGADGGLAIGNRAVNRQQLEAEFAQIAAMPEADQPIIRVRGDGGLAYQKIIDVLSLAKSKGLTKVGLDSEIR